VCHDAKDAGGTGLHHPVSLSLERRVWLAPLVGLVPCGWADQGYSQVEGVEGKSGGYNSGDGAE
jgi:hypothetical protein